MLTQTLTRALRTADDPVVQLRLWRTALVAVAVVAAFAGF